jgi:serine/threonine protein kinase
VRFITLSGSIVLLRERYRFLKILGKGVFCTTFLAVDESKSPTIPCVIQRFSQQNLTPEFFEHKARLLNELGKHSQIPNLLAYFQDNYHFYLVQEFIAGNNMAQMLEERGIFSEAQIWQILEQLLPVIEFIHNQNLVHCDIKPENIIFRNGDFILVDFAMSKVTTELATTANIIMGSPEYSAPEQTKGKPVLASDLYSLGVTCIYLLTHVPPFNLFDTINNSWVWRQYLTQKISEHLGKILDKLIENSTSERFQSTLEVMQAIGFYSPLPTTTYSQFSSFKWLCVHTLIAYSGSSSGVNSIAISPDGNTLASGYDDKTIKLWNLDTTINTAKIICILNGHTQAVKSVAFSPDGKILASGSDDKTIKLWNINTNEEICTLTGHSGAVKSVAFSHEGILASGSWDKTIKLWNVETSKEIITLKGHKLQVSSVTFSPDGKWIASASFDRTVRLWNLDKLKNRPCLILSGHTWAVLAVTFSPDGNILATGSEDNTIKLWQVNNGQEICTISGHSWAVVALEFSSNGETLISGSRDKTVKIWRVKTLKEITTFEGHIDSVSALAIHPASELIASASRDKTIKLWQKVE